MTTNSPKVSICLPNLNNRKYLPERLESILGQTLQDWELIVVDSYSHDGAWEFLQQAAAKDNRFRLSQAPRGLYASWNRCIRQARGQFVYIATSDDTMSPNGLEKMAAALEAHPECGLCQCGLRLIDESGQAHPSMLWQGFPFPRFAGSWMNRPHIRRAPLDGVLHFALETVYTSITQLLIRRSVFERVGMFDENLGSTGDFEWGMRAGLLEDCVFVPEPLATWRLHEQQISGGNEALAARGKLLKMSEVAFGRAREKSASRLDHWPLGQLLRFYHRQILMLQLAKLGTRWHRVAFLVREMTRGNLEAARYCLNKKERPFFHQGQQFEALREMLSKLGVAAPVFI